MPRTIKEWTNWSIERKKALRIRKGKLKGISPDKIKDWDFKVRKEEKYKFF